MADEGKQAWGDEISDERKTELEQRLQAWEQEADHGERKGSFDGVKLTGADVFWLAEQSLANSSHKTELAFERDQPFDIQDKDRVDLPTARSALQLQGANLVEAHLEGCNLAQVHLEWANLGGAYLQNANLAGAYLKSANLRLAHLQRANLAGAYLERATFRRASLEHALLNGAHLQYTNLSLAQLQGAFLNGAHLEYADLVDAHLEYADFERVHLEHALLNGAHLQGANLAGAHLLDSNLANAHLEGANLTHVYLDGATDLWNVSLSNIPVRLGNVRALMARRHTYGAVSLADVRWNSADLTVVDWSSLHRLGDERSKRWWWRSREESLQAMRANVQLARQLRDAGLNDDGDRFAYRAQVCQRGVHLLRLRFGRWLFSWLLFVVAGYGYRPLRTLFWYLAVIFGFAFLYMHFGHVGGHPFEFDEALVFSVTSFHGRGFFPGTLDLKDLVTKLAASEAVFGLFIEVSFIATFTQRYFGK